MLVDLWLTVIVHCFHHLTSKDILFRYLNNVLPLILIADLIISFNIGHVKKGKMILNKSDTNKRNISAASFYFNIFMIVCSIVQIIFQHTILQ